jgi:Cu2+-exporting ATPase
MKEATVQIDGMMSIFDGAGVEKQIKRRDGVVRANANFLNGTASIVYDEARVSLDDINRFIAECGYHCRGEVVPEHLCEPGKRNEGRGPPHKGASGSRGAVVTDARSGQTDHRENQVERPSARKRSEG